MVSFERLGFSIKVKAFWFLNCWNQLWSKAFYFDLFKSKSNACLTFSATRERQRKLQSFPINPSQTTKPIHTAKVFSSSVELTREFKRVPLQTIIKRKHLISITKCSTSFQGKVYSKRSDREQSRGWQDFRTKARLKSFHTSPLSIVNSVLRKNQLPHSDGNLKSILRHD